MFYCIASNLVIHYTIEESHNSHPSKI